MTGTIVSLASGREYSVEQLLDIVDSLRESIVSGEVVALAAVGLTPDSSTLHWIGSARVTPPLLLAGAIASLHHSYVGNLL